MYAIRSYYVGSIPRYIVVKSKEINYYFSHEEKERSLTYWQTKQNHVHPLGCNKKVNKGVRGMRNNFV